MSTNRMCPHTACNAQCVRTRAQLPPSQRRGVPHHLLDVRDVGADYSAGDFADEGRAALGDVVAVGDWRAVSLHSPCGS